MASPGLAGHPLLTCCKDGEIIYLCRLQTEHIGGVGSNATRNEYYAEGVGPELPGTATNNSKNVARIDAEDEGLLNGLVASLLGLDLEGVFRTVVRFL